MLNMRNGKSWIAFIVILCLIIFIAVAMTISYLRISKRQREMSKEQPAQTMSISNTP